jgi:hypothetical protein
LTLSVPLLDLVVESRRPAKTAHQPEPRAHNCGSLSQGRSGVIQEGVSSVLSLPVWSLLQLVDTSWGNRLAQLAAVVHVGRTGCRGARAPRWRVHSSCCSSVRGRDSGRRVSGHPSPRLAVGGWWGKSGFCAAAGETKDSRQRDEFGAGRRRRGLQPSPVALPVGWSSVSCCRSSKLLC